MDKVKEVEVEIFEKLEETKDYGDLRQKYAISHFDKFIDMASNDVVKNFVKNVMKNLVFSDLLNDLLIENKEEIVGLRNKLKLSKFKDYKNQIRSYFIEENLTTENIIEIEKIMDEFELEIFNNFSEDKPVIFYLDLFSEIENKYFIIYDDGNNYHINSKTAEFLKEYGYDESCKIKDALENLRLYLECNNTNSIELKLENNYWVDINVRTLEYLGENISIAVINNISENKKIEKELRESEEKYKTLLNMLPDPVYVISKNLIEYANNAALEMFGVKNLEEVIGRELSYFLKVPIKYQSLVQQQEDILKRTFILTPVERKYIRKSDNKYLDIESTAAIIKNQDRELILNVCRDIEVRKKIEKLKQRVNEKSLKLKEATKYDEIKNEFFANISHEFRTPINVILGVIQLFEKVDDIHDAYEVQEKLRKYIGITKQNCYRLIRLVNNLIDITKIDAGHLKINLVRLDIVNLIESICMSVVDYMRTKGIELIFDTDIEELEICVDPDKIERIMLNLLSNAIKFTNPNGQVFINMYYNNGYIDIVVRDTGIGIPKEKQKEVFNRFVQVERTLSRNREGSGIGLSLVKAFVEMHNGELILNSEVGKGSEFIIKIPTTNEESECICKDEVSIKCGNIESINIEFSDIYS